MANTIKAKVRNTEEVLFEGDVDRISSYNEVGPFDIYPMHANFISIIQQKLELYQNHQKIKDLKLEKAVLKVKQDSVHIFLGIEVLLVEDSEDPKSSNTPPSSPPPSGQPANK